MYEESDVATPHGKLKEELVIKADNPVVLNIIAFISPLPMVIHAATEQNGVRNISAASDCNINVTKHGFY